MTNELLNEWKKEKIVEDGDIVLAGVSGGADSVCLLLMLEQLQKKTDFLLEAVHVEHGLFEFRTGDYGSFRSSLLIQIHSEKGVCMKRFLFLAMFVFAVSAFSGDGKTGVFQRKPDGSFQVEDLTFALAVRNPKWATSIQSGKTIRASANVPQADRNHFRLQGDFQVRNGIFKLDETFVSLPSRPGHVQ